MAETFYVSLDLQSAINSVDKAVLDQSWMGERIDHYTVSVENTGSFVQLVYEKYYMRAGNRLTLTVSLDDFTGKTRVHCVSGGGGESLFDLSASDSFSDVIKSALARWRV